MHLRLVTLVRYVEMGGTLLPKAPPDWEVGTMPRWWNELGPETRAWLIDNNGDTVPPDVALQIEQAGGGAALVGSEDHDVPGVYLSDEAVDWIEAVANGEEP